MSNEKEVEDFLAHYGKKGMKWGVRGTRRAQKRLDRTHRIATGKASVVDRALGSALTAKGANRQLQRGANHQAKINSGQRKVSNMLATASGVKIKNLDFHKTGDAKAKMDNGEKAAVAYLGVLGAVTLAGAISSRK